MFVLKEEKLRKLNILFVLVFKKKYMGYVIN